MLNETLFHLTFGRTNFKACCSILIYCPICCYFFITFAAGLLALSFKVIDDKRMHLLLAFSGSFLLSITILHLIPETVEELGHKAGIYILAGFFLQLLIQRFTHGVEHGHTHVGEHDHKIPLLSILAGLALHAFMEGLPLGFNYRNANTDTALYMAVAAHKLPEIMLAATLIKSVYHKTPKSVGLLLLFALCTPLASMTASFLGSRYYAISSIVSVLIPIVAGAFIHIATTIFFESGTRQHMLSWQKTLVIIAGVALSTLTLLNH